MPLPRLAPSSKQPATPPSPSATPIDDGRWHSAQIVLRRLFVGAGGAGLLLTAWTHWVAGRTTLAVSLVILGASLIGSAWTWQTPRRPMPPDAATNKAVAQP